jgi:uncharacterized protein (DUF1800 family)
MVVEAVIAANRFGLGARPGELAAIADDPRGWLGAQITDARPTPEPLKALPSSARVFESFTKVQEARRDARKKEKEQANGEVAKQFARTVRNELAPMYLDQVSARYRTAISSEESFRERLVHFWTNHFAVSAEKPQLIALAATLENEAVRPHNAGRFADLLLAVEAHPAMILYLDNHVSVGPNSALALRAAKRPRNEDRKLGINENLAREILELHTLGVNGGYTQADVTAFAQALTGWSIGGGPGMLREGQPGTFTFRNNAHEPGTRTILGKRYGEPGVEQPRAVLNDLATHPATATHIATKLVRHFVADEPPAEAVMQVARTFRDTEGDLPAIYRALIQLPQAWAQPFAKFKTPHEFVVSTFRMCDFVPREPRQVAAPFQLLGQRPYSPGSPAGWPDTADHWDGPDALLKRIEWASALAERFGSKYRALELATHSLGEHLSEYARTAISRSADSAQGFTLLLASPAFQRR